VDKFHIKKISEISKEKLSQFYQNSFNYEKPILDNYNWRYRSGFNEFEPLALIINDQICGHAGLIPINLKVNNKIEKAIWFTDFYINAELRARGYGAQLTKEWMKICPIQITLCNNQSLKIFKKLDWSVNNNFTRRIKFYNYFKIIPIFRKLNNDVSTQKDFGKLKLEVLDNNFMTRILDSSEKSLSKKSIGIIRDENWFKWRIIDCPYKKNIYFFSFENNLIITNIKKKNNLKILNIIYSSRPLNTDITKLFLSFAKNNNINYLSYISVEKKLSDIFLPWERKLNFTFYSKEKSTSNLLDEKLDDIQFVDSDIDYI